LGQRGDAATALVEADYGVDAASGTGVNGPADVGGSWRTSAASSARAEPATERAVAKATVNGRARHSVRATFSGRGLPALPH